MENIGRKAAILAAAFASVGALGAAYFYRHDIAFSIADVVHPEWNAGEARLADAYDRRYTLLNNGDGTETALYDDSTAVTFRHDGAGDLVWLFGTASLLAPLAPNYFAFHGFSYTGGRMDRADDLPHKRAALTAAREIYRIRHRHAWTWGQSQLCGAQLQRKEKREVGRGQPAIRLRTGRHPLLGRFVT